MKKLTPTPHVLFTIILFVFLIFESTFTMGQTCFIDPANPETACSCSNTAANVTHSGNDCRYPIFYPNDLDYVIVNVYDGDYPGI